MSADRERASSAAKTVDNIEPLDTTIGEDPRTIRFARTVELFDIGKERERRRGHIAFALIAVLAATVLGTFALVFVDMLAISFAAKLHVNPAISITDIKELLTLLLSPIVALVGTATGFYFGGQSHQ